MWNLENGIYIYILYIDFLQHRNRDTDIENKHMVANVETDIYTTMHET